MFFEPGSHKIRRSTLVLLLLVAMAAAGTAVPALAAMSLPDRPTSVPATVGRVNLSIDGYTIANFASMEYTDESEQTEYYQEGPEGPIIQPMFAPKPLLVTCRRPLSNDLQLSAWREQGRQGQTSTARRNARITIYSSVGLPLARWQMVNAFPLKLTVKADSAGNYTEEITFVCDELARVAP